MPPESAARPARPNAAWDRIAPDWREPLVGLALASALLMLVARAEWAEMLHQWWVIDTYSHILVVPLIIGWLVAIKRAELVKGTPQAWLPGLAMVGAALLIWLLGRVSGINLLAHAGAVGALQAAVIALLGPRASLLLALPIAMGVFLVPFGDEIIPPLQMITAKIAIALTHWSGVEAEIEGINIFTPAGLFIVAEACSGVRFLIAMIALAVLVCFTALASWRRRAAFMAAAVIVPIIANGVRAWGTIYLAQIYGAEWAAGFDHIVYGWIFFALVLAAVLGATWRWFERAPEDYGWRAEDLPANAVFLRLDGLYAPASAILTRLGVLALVISALAAFVPTPPLG